MSRLASGGLIDRSRPLRFSFDGRAMTGFAGDTLASALIANDVRLIGRSFKYHRPRGILTAGGEEPSALVTLGRGAHAEPNTRATTVPLTEGLEAFSQNRWPSLRFDLLAVNQLFSPLFVAGFYYKTFMWPAAFWEKVYEPLIRRAAGMGKLSGLPDPARYDRNHGFCDLLVIGSGPAGLAAALAAGRAGLRVILAEQDVRLGGRLLSERHEIDGTSGSDWATAAAAELASLPTVRVLTRTSVFGVYDGREYGAVEHLDEAGGGPRQRLWKIVAKQAVLAAGAIERPLVFAGNDRPGVMMASAVSTYLNRFAAAPGETGIVFTTTDSGWRTAEDLIAAGRQVAAVVDPRPTLPPAAERLRQAGVRIHSGSVIAEVRGRKAVIRSADGGSQSIAADFVAMSGGWNPSIGLASNLGARPVWSETLSTFLMETAPPGMRIAGAAAGELALGEVLRSGAQAGAAAAQALGHEVPAAAYRTSDDPAGSTALWHVPGGRGKAFVDFQHDVTDQDIELAAREGFVSIEHLKRYTTLGMATDQGKSSQLNGHALLSAAVGKSMAETGTILSRPPYLPVSIGVLAGYHRGEEFRPVRKTPSHGWAVERGASFTDAGLWKRAQWFALPGEGEWRQTVDREVRAVRGGVGICDVSTLGKIDVHGPDAGALLDRLYINGFAKLPVGRARYGVMLREDGIVLDDGTTTRLADDHFYVTTTTANAARVMQHVDFARAVLWPGLDVQATSVTEQWATFAVAGPRSRALLEAAFPALALANEALPYMHAVEFEWQGHVARIFRLSFSGELAYEVAVPAMLGDALVRHLFAVGEAFGAVPYGTEALGVMRIEKGHPAGNELSGQTTARDLGLGGLMSTRKDFIGRIMTERPAFLREDRPSLVGLKPIDARSPIRSGAHLLRKGAAAVAANDQGYVTSAAFSPTLGHPIALALLAGGMARTGERVVVHDPVRGPDTIAEVCHPVFVDPEGRRLRD